MTIIRTLTLVALLTPALMAQAPPATPAPQAPPTEPDPATLRAMRSKVFVIQHRDPFRLQQSLDPLGSGTKGARMNWSKDEGFNTITVRDFPENLAAIEEAIKRLDVPSATQSIPNVELHLQVLFASKSPMAEGGIPESLQSVIRVLKGTLPYRGYTIGAEFLHRSRIQSDQANASDGYGEVDASALADDRGKDVPPLTVQWRAQHGVSLEVQKEGPAVFRMRSFWLKLEEKTSSGYRTIAQIDTDLSLKEGEKVVVGTTVVKNRGLIVVISAKRVD